MSEERKILCVDDEKNVLKSLERLFLDSEFEILTATSGSEGLEIIENEGPIPLIVSDYRMPQMNGVDFLKEVFKRWPDTVRIVLSGYADTVAIVGAINEGHIYKFIPKPWNDDELKVTISTALDYYDIQQKNIRLAEELEAKNNELLEMNNNLEKIVEKRTADLVMQNKMLTSSQNILDALPVGVIGIDPEGVVVQCNEKGMTLLHNDEQSAMGLNAKESFPSEINAFIEKVEEKGQLEQSISDDGLSVDIKGVHMKYESGQEGIILVLDEGKGNG